MERSPTRIVLRSLLLTAIGLDLWVLLRVAMLAERGREAFGLLLCACLYLPCFIVMLACVEWIPTRWVENWLFRIGVAYCLLSPVRILIKHGLGQRVLELFVSF